MKEKMGKIKYNSYIRCTAYSALIIILLVLGSCQKLVEVPPPVTSVTNASAFNSDATAISVLTGFYSDMANPVYGVSLYNSTIYLGLASDEFTTPDNTSAYPAYYQNALSGTDAGFELWNTFYPIIYRLNEAIEGLNTSVGLTSAIKQQLLGEAFFLRGFYYFQLTNLYGDVPLILTTDLNQNRQASKTTQAQVFSQVKADLLQAQNLLNKKFPDGTLVNVSGERVRPTYWAATAMLSRFYLYTKQWADAEQQATILISNSSLFGLSNLDNAFLRAGLGNNEAIWQLQPPQPSGGADKSAPDAAFVIIGGPQPTSILLSDALLKAFENGDLRKSKWADTVSTTGITYYFPYKYKIPGANADEYVMMFRLAEQYLIRAEARAQLNESNAIADVNMIRRRAGLSDYAGPTDQASLLTAIYHERQVELFSEQGHRWFDLKRTGLINTVMPAIASAKGGTWVAYKQLFPVPAADIKNDRNITQNPGY